MCGFCHPKVPKVFPSAELGKLAFGISWVMGGGCGTRGFPGSLPMVLRTRWSCSCCCPWALPNGDGHAVQLGRSHQGLRGGLEVGSLLGSFVSLPAAEPLTALPHRDLCLAARRALLASSGLSLLLNALCCFARWQSFFSLGNFNF